MSSINILNHGDTKEINSEFMIDGKLQVKPFSFIRKYPMNTIHLFMLEHGIYVLPTTELIDFLKENIIGNAIEIGAGNGAIGRALNIPITDSRLQERPDIIQYYKAMKQPIIKYPKDVEKMDGEIAVDKYRPDTVIGAFITHRWNGRNGNAWGVDERNLLKMVKRYIHIGNLVTHQHSDIIKDKHEEHYFPWIVTRAVHQKENRIFIF